MTLGEWLGKWSGSWFGATTTDPNAISGQWDSSLSGSATLAATAALSGESATSFGGTAALDVLNNSQAVLDGQWISAFSATATLDLLGEQPANIWDTTQGVAPGYLKFRPMQDAETRMPQATVSTAAWKPQPWARAYANFGNHAGHASSSRFHTHECSAAAAMCIGSIQSASSIPSPHARAYASIAPATTTAKVAFIAPTASAVSKGDTRTSLSDAGIFRPWGIRNPTDEELMVLVIAARNKNKLTRKQV